MENSEFISLFGDLDKQSHDRIVSRTLHQLEMAEVPVEKRLEYLEVRTSLANLYRRYNKMYTLGWQDAAAEVQSPQFINRAVFAFSSITHKQLMEVAQELRRSLMLRNNTNVRNLWVPGSAG